VGRQAQAHSLCHGTLQGLSRPPVISDDSGNRGWKLFDLEDLRKVNVSRPLSVQVPQSSTQVWVAGDEAFESQVSSML
jgi:hypothetical protein